MRGFDRISAGLSLALVVALLAALALSPIAIDTFHMDDLQFLAHLGWRGLHGLTPVIDYPHFYGGVVAGFVTQAFIWFGVAYKTVDYAIVMLFLVAGAALAVLAFRRIGLPAALLGLLVAAVVVLSRVPMEHSKMVGSAHSFVYNHFAVALIVTLSVFDLFAQPRRGLERGAAVICGVVLFVIALTKPTFVVVAPFFWAALGVQRRWDSLGWSIAGAIVAMLVLDFGGRLYFGAFGHLLNAAADMVGGLQGLILSLLKMAQRHALAGMIALLFVLWGWRMLGHAGLPFLGALAVLSAGFAAAAATMGSDPRAQLLPWMVLVCLLVAEKLRQAGVARSPWAMFGAALLIWGMGAHAVANSVFVSVVAAQSRDLALIYDGPAASYVVHGRTLKDAVEGVQDRTARQDRANAAAEANIANGGPIDESVEYIVWTDGIALLRGIVGVETYGIVSNGRMFDFTVPLQARPVASLTPWPSRPMLEAMPMAPFAPDVDLVMLAHKVPENAWSLVTEQVQHRMGDGFEPCRASNFWVLHKRIGADIDGCDMLQETGTSEGTRP